VETYNAGPLLLFLGRLVGLVVRVGVGGVKLLLAVIGRWGDWRRECAGKEKKID